MDVAVKNQLPSVENFKKLVGMFRFPFLNLDSEAAFVSIDVVDAYVEKA